MLYNFIGLLGGGSQMQILTKFDYWNKGTFLRRDMDATWSVFSCLLIWRVRTPLISEVYGTCRITWSIADVQLCLKKDKWSLCPIWTWGDGLGENPPESWIRLRLEAHGNEPPLIGYSFLCSVDLLCIVHKLGRRLTLELELGLLATDKLTGTN